MTTQLASQILIIIVWFLADWFLFVKLYPKMKEVINKYITFILTMIIKFMITVFAGLAVQFVK